MRPFQYKPPLNSGDFRNRIIIEQLIETIDPITDRVMQKWSEIKKTWAIVKTIKGSEYVSAATTKEKVERTYRFIIRYSLGIENSVQTRIKFNNRIFDIESILHDDELKKTITIMAVEVL